MVQVAALDPSLDLEYTNEETGEVTVYNLGNIAWSEWHFLFLYPRAVATADPNPVLTSMCLVWLMVPGVGLFYSGLLRRKNALSMIMLSLLGIAVGSFQWFFWGYSLTFAADGGP